MIMFKLTGNEVAHGLPGVRVHGNAVLIPWQIHALKPSLD